MQEIHGTAVGSVNAAPDATFRLITDIDRLPEWNRAIERVVEPAPDLTPGTEWVVKMHPSRGMTWQSRSRVEEIDSDTRRFRYRTWNTDGNPSYADWKWEVVAARVHGAGERQLGRVSQDAGSQVAGRPDSTAAAAQRSSRVAAGARPTSRNA